MIKIGNEIGNESSVTIGFPINIRTRIEPGVTQLGIKIWVEIKFKIGVETWSKILIGIGTKI